MTKTDDTLKWLEELRQNSSKVVDPSINLQDYRSINISSKNEDLKHFDISDSEQWILYLQSFLNENKGKVAFGGYLENRDIYKRSSYFSSKNSDRNIHLGVDFWTDQGTSVHAVLDGKIHSVKNNQNHGDYGPTIILEHHKNDIVFYSLYGHLSVDSINQKRVGDKVQSGEKIGELGKPAVNGDYAPHLHFQLILDLEGNVGDYPGVCSVEQLEHYTKNCPNPLFLVNLELSDI